MSGKQTFQFEISLPVAGFHRETGDYGDDKALRRLGRREMQAD